MRYFTFDIYPELQFRTSRSGGKGGQHVNKTESKVEVIFNIAESLILDQETKDKLLLKLGSPEVSVYAQDSRSQQKNKETAIKKLLAILDKALVPVVKRKKTKISKAAKAKRLDEKKKHSEKKEGRRRII